MRILSTTLGAALALLVSTYPFAASARGGDDAAPTGQAGSTTPAPSGGASGISEEAREHFAAGVTLLQDPEGAKYEEAYREFRTAYEISSSPKILGNMAFCAMKLERDGEAIEAYTRYLREVPDIDAEERAQIVRDVQTLSVGVVRLTIEVDKPGVRIIDVRTPVRGDRITNTYGPVTGKIEIGVRPGHHVITAKLPDHEDAMWELDAFAATRDRYAFTMKPRVVAPAFGQQPQSSSNVGPWIVVGIGGAMLAAGAITGVVALGKTHDIEARCPNDTCPKTFDLEGERSSAKTFVRITDVLLIGGGVVAAGGLGWLLFGGPSKAEAEPPKAGPAQARRSRPPIPNAGCGPDGCRASLEVVF